MSDADQNERAPQERRRTPRHLCGLKMTYTILSSADSTPYEYGVAHSRNFSESGACVCTEHEIFVPSLMRLSITLPLASQHIMVLAKSLRCTRNAQTGYHEIGLKFVGVLPPEFKRLVADLAEDEVTRLDTDLDID